MFKPLWGRTLLCRFGGGLREHRGWTAAKCADDGVAIGGAEGVASVRVGRVVCGSDGAHAAEAALKHGEGGR
jgi:hypothetical protein